MQLLVDTIGNVIAVGVLGTVVLYAPFAKNWLRAIWSVFFITLLWGIVRIVASVFFTNEGDVPLIQKEILRLCRRTPEV